MQVSGERRRRQLHERLAFTLTYRERVSPMDVQAAEAEALRKLLTLATQHPNSLEELKVTLKDDTSGARDGYWLSTRSPRADVRHGRTEFRNSININYCSRRPICQLIVAPISWLVGLTC